MLDWARAAFSALGPMNERAQASVPHLMAGAEYVGNLDRSDLAPDGWAATLYQAADEGKLDMDEARKLVFDFVIPSVVRGCASQRRVTSVSC